MLARVELHPIDLGFGSRRAERGRPLLAHVAKADRILERLQRLSQQHETAVTREGDALVLKLL
jgi:hypothetical protein